LYNLLSTANWFSFFNKNTILKKENSISKYFFNIIFFHFWASFFSSILLIYTIINFYLVFGTTEWVYLNFLIDLTYKGMYNTNILYIYVNLLIFFISFLIKLGISPFFLFKLEIYRGMPLYNIFFYSVVFFLLFFIIFFLILYYYLPILVGSLHFFFNLILLFSVITVIFFLFDNTLLRNFFAFSSVINSINLTILLI
jgi:NADH:ubiquinone oxidoreductase subunit 2 (subunit N)